MLVLTIWICVGPTARVLVGGSPNGDRHPAARRSPRRARRSSPASRARPGPVVRLLHGRGRGGMTTGAGSLVTPPGGILKFGASASGGMSKLSSCQIPPCFLSRWNHCMEESGGETHALTRGARDPAEAAYGALRAGRSAHRRAGEPRQVWNCGDAKQLPAPGHETHWVTLLCDRQRRKLKFAGKQPGLPFG